MIRPPRNSLEVLAYNEHGRQKFASSKLNMKLHSFTNILLGTLLLLATVVSCTSAQSQPISLTSLRENYVDISIYLERNSAGDYFLSARFTPPDGYHLYSKDIPLTGVNGLGRPTLLELTSAGLMKSTGELIESVKAQTPDFEPKGLLVYPAGPVTLSLPVQLPPGDAWVNDEVKITFMACTDNQCKPPVVGKIVQIRVPSVGVLDGE
jgi:hypothetical protein